MVKTGLYRHFKGGLYRVLYTARHSETLEDMVVYQSVQDAEKVWVRPACMWCDTVERGGESFVRFTYLGEEE